MWEVGTKGKKPIDWQDPVAAVEIVVQMQTYDTVDIADKTTKIK